MQTPTIPVSVNLIVKNCSASLDACLASLRSFVVSSDDEIVVVDTGSTDDGATVAVARRHGAQVIERPDLSVPVGEKARQWLPEWAGIFAGNAPDDGRMLMDFGAARQIALDASRHDCVFWIDSDDTLWEQNPGQLRMVVEQGFRAQFEVLLLDYEYLYDPRDGRCMTLLRRERVVDRRLYRWEGCCHEIMIAVDANVTGRLRYYYDLPVRIRHTAHRLDSRPADARNYLILRSALEDDHAAGRPPNARTHYYLGNACRGLGRQREAEQHYRETLRLAGSAENCYSAQLCIAEMCLTPPDLRPEDAVAAGRACIELSPRDPRGHFTVSRACAVMGRWQEALQWFEAGRQLPMPQTSHAVNPEQVTSQPLAVAAKAAIELGRLDYAGSLAEELRRTWPDRAETQATLAELEAALTGRQPGSG